ncbi:MAG: hypothetical protein KJZ73_13005 [Pseudorhodoplanes sp.]|nr:hypothetical protein [Pseudorhodoplanes sp.]
MAAPIRYILSLGVLALVAPVFALAHEWYPPDCCSGQDCAPIDDGRVTRTQAGDYLIDGRWMFPRDDDAQTRRSLSGRYHACFPRPDERPRCLFVPPEGS